MCNVYSLTKSAIRQLFRVTRDLTGNLPPLPGIFPDGMAPVVRTGTDRERELAMLMLGASEPTSHSSFSAPPSFLGGAF
jgi:putative SOS response-associated peptidase YedK